jgi:uncharacterized protein (TIRG00374 family)
MTSNSAPSSRRGQTVKHWLKVGFGLLILALVVRFALEVDWKLLGDRMRTARVELVVLTTALLFARLLSWHFRWGATLARTEDRTSPVRRFTILLGSVLANHVLPSMRVAGGLLRARYLARMSPLTFGQSYATVLFDTAVHHATSGVFTWATMVGASWVLGYRWVGAGLLLAGGVVMVLVASRLSRRDPVEGAVSRYLRRLREPGGRLHQLAHRGRGLAEMLRHLAGERVLWWQVPLLSVVWMTSSVAAQWVLFIALDVPVGFWTAAASVGLGVIATVLTQTPGGIGSTEAAMVAAYTAFGIDQVDALAGTLLFRGIHYALVLGLGAPSLLYCELLHSRASASRDRA